jgi:hypothetical protein
MHLRGYFGPTLERLRGGRSLAVLAEELGHLTVDDLIDIEHGRWHPPWRTVLEICDGLGLDLLQRQELRRAYEQTSQRRAANPWVGGRRRAS